ncbi:hypothetical protein CBA19CS22_38040 [Caballeronia novacaledonica]|uniref:Uncharacterized protein n=1 Tax=Caballeronia novacaledonica TaxID=1544861 RepID=A0ACB5R635_9BURK|nr:hypothetical protein CBA19CS22_38040 [Caballeronia novacaledonica]
MFDVFESMSMWLNACARAAWLWSMELDKASAMFGEGFRDQQPITISTVRGKR